MASSNAITQIKADEGTRSKAYKDSKGVLSIGIGFNLERVDAREQLLLAGVSPTDIDDIMKVGGKALTPEQTDSLFQNSLQQSEADAASYAGNVWGTLPQAARDVLVNMSFQLGSTKLNKFKEMKKAYRASGGVDWKGVREEMLDSKWAEKDTPKRANRLHKQLGSLEPEVVKEEPKPTPVSFEQAFKESNDDAVASRLAGLMSADTRVQGLAEKVREMRANKEEAPAEVKAAPKFEQGLLQDESGKKFFADGDKLLELDGNNHPQAVADTTQLKLSKVQAQSSASPEEEIF